jgi:ATPase family associated with various cellular activities (AAA)
MQADSWQETNQRYLVEALASVRAALEQHAHPREEAAEPGEPGEQARMLPEADSSTPAPPALDMLCAAFDLTPFERDLLLMCAGVELDSTFAALCASANGDPQLAYPTFGLALAALPGSHWSAITPAAPLRYWRLVELGTSDALTTSPLRIDERVLHYLAGIAHLDERLHGLVEPLRPPEELPPSHRALVHKITALWSRAEGESLLPAIQLCGDEDAGKREVAAASSAALGLGLHAISAAAIPTTVVERETLTRMWEREAVLSGSALLLDCEDTEGPADLRPALSFAERLRGVLIVTGGEPLHVRARPFARLDVDKPSATEQQELWHEALGPLSQELNGQIEGLAAQFNLGAQQIRAASAEVLADLSQSREGVPASRMLWETCCAQARPRLEDLAQRIEPVAGWHDLVLPEPQRQLLHDVAVHVRQRAKVHEAWGFAAKGTRGLGISALFSGPSGTGKTMAAEVLANELQLDLYRIDLSQVVSKYIGETEKNLRRVFDTAEGGGAILLFDEADALFGKRSEVRDSHDRYANIEVSYLLQRMEAYRGLAILTSNMKNALDPAFMRRIRFVVQFPFPDAEQRAEIWNRIFPDNAPTEGLDTSRLARLNVAGGNIKNIALSAAFLAADAGDPVRMAHLLHAARGEYAKLEKPLTEAEMGGWA